MLNATFQRLLPRVGADLEASLWRKGVCSWEDYESHQTVQHSLFSDWPLQSAPFASCREALYREDAVFFAKSLTPREHYRIPLTFPHRTLFLDIETTGLSRYYDVITIIGWTYRDSYHVYVMDGDDGPLRAALRDAQTVITFNGALFDLPFLKTRFPDLILPPVHIDLRFFGRRADLTGTQKDIEAALGFSRPAHLRDMRGESAPILWHRYRRGSLDALKLLIEYNHCDIEGMKFIFDHAISRLLERHGVPKRIRAQVPRFAVATKIQWTRGKKRRRAEIALHPYRGPSGPAIALDELDCPRPWPDLRITGIDLTGSEQRPSGFCLLERNNASTSRLATDEEIFEKTVLARPHVVSIDSPLSLPRGRTSVSDDDPGREQYGIMRHCERVLKQRGINVYPALIPSMQRLTARGIRLAARFRSVGLPVIESYPGAAQDIMGIPRKRASLGMLQEGLTEFGVRGAYESNPVSHDELDAITAAVVGVFFWSGKFETLGSDEEEALIIPDLKRDARVWNTRRVIGVSGRLAAGKTTTAQYLKSRGFHYGRYSMVLEELLRAEGQPGNRAALQVFGEKVHCDRGQRWLGRRLLESSPKERDIVIDGLRFPDDHAFLAEAFGPGFFHVHIEAAEIIRRSRFVQRGGSEASFPEAEIHPVEQQVEKLRGLANVTVKNEGELSTLYGTIDALLKSAF